jgi:response regulator RpfG family c-di-GMP phosphodiesterase
MDETGRKKVLIVDDEQPVRDVLNRTLVEAGYECVTASHVDEALFDLGQERFNLVLSDILMPGKTGIDLLEEVVRTWPDTAVMMVTAVAETSTAVKALKMGACDYITKPFDLEEVVISVRRALDLQSLQVANREYRDHLEQKVEAQTEKLRETFLGAVRSLAEALDAKDRYTRGHSERVTLIARTLAEAIGMDDAQVERVRLAGTVHDIGKIGVPEKVLNKPGRLTDGEFEKVKVHSELGEKILKSLVRDEQILAYVRHHHERYGGGGYPDGIAGDEIPLGARLLAVADAYDAMTSDRPYREAVPEEEAQKQLLANRGNQFDPEVVDSFMRVKDRLSFCALKDSSAGKEG